MLHVHRLPARITDSELQRLFQGVGRVVNCDVITGGSTCSSKVIGFVEMATEEAQRAIEQLHGKEFVGRAIHVSQGS